MGGEVAGQDRRFAHDAVELASEDEQIALPDWVADEVTHEERYYNVSLVHYPYKDW